MQYGVSNAAAQPPPLDPLTASREAYSRWLQSQSLLAQLADAEIGRRDAGIYNANAIAQARQGQAASRYGLGQDVRQTQLSVERGLTDLAQQRLSNIRYGLNLRRDLASLRNQVEPGYGARAQALFGGR